MPAMAFVIVSVRVLLLHSGDCQDLIMVRAAVRSYDEIIRFPARCHGLRTATTAMPAIHGMSRTTAVWSTAMMPRMNVRTAHAAYETGKETAPRAVARMHVKAYDTYAVP